MIGILCSEKTEDILVKHFHALLKAANLSKHGSVVIFTMANTDLSNRTVFGSVVTEDKIKQVETTLPDVIFNLSVQYKRTHIKKLRELFEVKDVSIINASNQYNQCSIMDILSASNQTRSFVLPYTKSSENDTCFNFPEDCKLLIKPECKPSLSGIAFVEPSLSGLDINSGQGKLFCQRQDFFNTVRPIIPCEKWVLLKTPDLISCGSHLLINRVYLQRRSNGEWTVITRNIYPEEKDIRVQFTDSINNISLQLINLIHCYITDMGICYIDFIFDTLGNPYFLNFGGYDNKLLDKKQNKDVQIRFFKNMLEYAKGFVNKPKGEFDYVD